MVVLLARMPGGSSRQMREKRKERLCRKTGCMRVEISTEWNGNAMAMDLP